MPSSYTTNLGVEKPANGEQDGVWGDIVNDNMDIVDRAINGGIVLSLTGTSSTLTTSDGILSDGQNKLLILGGAPSGTHTITIVPNDAEKIYYVYNLSGQSVVFTQGSGTTVTVAHTDAAIVYADGGGAGAGVINITDHFAMSSVRITGGTITNTAITGGTITSTAVTSGTITNATITGGSVTGITDLAVADGGTGASDAATARANLGLSAAVSGPASATDNAIVRFDGTTGKLVQDSAVVVADSGATTVTVTDAVTNAVTTALRLDHQSSGTPAANIGVGVEFAIETSAGNTEVGAAVEALATTVTAGAENVALRFSTMASGATAAERMRIHGSGLVSIGPNPPAPYPVDILAVDGGGTFGGPINANGGYYVLDEAVHVLKTQVFYGTPGTTTYTVPPGCTYLRVIVIGAGGGGGGVDGQGSGTSALGGNGGGGGMTLSFFAANEASYTMTIGAGGAGGAAGANAGSAGGTSSFVGGSVNLEAFGGGGGGGKTASSSTVSGSGTAGEGAAAATEDGTKVCFRGGAASSGLTSGGNVAMTGLTGCSFYSLPLRHSLSSGAGQTGNYFGGGGQGACVEGVSTNYAGGNGAQGGIIIEEFF